MSSDDAFLMAGDRVRFDGRVYEVAGLDGAQTVLVSADGRRGPVPVTQLVSAADFAVVDFAPRRTLAGMGRLESLPAEVVADAQWWEQRILEVLDCRGGGSVRQREVAKVAELAAAGHELTLRSFQRRRVAYERLGLIGLVDGRLLRRQTSVGRTDERVVAALLAVLAENTGRSSGTLARLLREVRARLDDQYGPGQVPMPSTATFHRLVTRLREGRNALGSARARRTRAQQPDGLHGQVRAARPGEVVEIDSTPLDVAVVLGDGVIGRVELTALVDNATRTVAGAVLRPTTKAVDASHLLARAMTPEPMRPGWPETIAMAYSALPFQAMRSVDERIANAAARPVIIPETVVYDHGKVFLSDTFRRACRTLGISLQPAHPDTPTDKPHVERTLQSVGTLFVQHVAGYLGSSVERRGKNAELAATFSLVELQDLLDEWIVTGWQNRPHDGLRDPLAPDRALTPNEMYAALLNVAGYVPVPLSGQDFIELLPMAGRVIGRGGIKINHRVYDCAALNPYREQRSGVKDLGNLWEVRYDPYDITRVWVRNHHDGGWLTVPWRALTAAPTPFGEDAWAHARQTLAQRGVTGPTEQQINDLVNDLLNRASAGAATTVKPTRRANRVAARTKTMNAVRQGDPLPASSDAQPPGAVQAAECEPADSHAEVIPLKIYNAQEEASRWW